MSLLPPNCQERFGYSIDELMTDEDGRPRSSVGMAQFAESRAFERKYGISMHDPDESSDERLEEAFGPTSLPLFRVLYEQRKAAAGPYERNAIERAEYAHHIKCVNLGSGGPELFRNAEQRYQRALAECVQEQTEADLKSGNYTGHLWDYEPHPSVHEQLYKKAAIKAFSGEYKQEAQAIDEAKIKGMKMLKETREKRRAALKQMRAERKARGESEYMPWDKEYQSTFSVPRAGPSTAGEEQSGHSHQPATQLFVDMPKSRREVIAAFDAAFARAVAEHNAKAAYKGGDVPAVLEPSVVSANAAATPGPRDTVKQPASTNPAGVAGLHSDAVESSPVDVKNHSSASISARRKQARGGGSGSVARSQGQSRPASSSDWRARAAPVLQSTGTGAAASGTPTGAGSTLSRRSQQSRRPNPNSNLATATAAFQDMSLFASGRSGGGAGHLSGTPQGKKGERAASSRDWRARPASSEPAPAAARNLDPKVAQGAEQLEDTRQEQ